MRSYKSIITRDMAHNTVAVPTTTGAGEDATDLAWGIVSAAARHAERVTDGARDEDEHFVLGADGELRAVPPGHAEAVLAWRARGWERLLPADDARSPLIDLYLPICGA